jgi:hypothetical protein
MTPESFGQESSSTDTPVLGHGSHRYRLNRQWSSLDAARTPVRNCHEMVFDSKGRLLLLTDEVKNNIIIYNPDGTLSESWGTRWPGGHGLTLSNENGEEFLFITDGGSFADPNNPGKSLQQAGTVSKTTLDGRLVFDIGHPQTIGVYEPGQPYKPTEVAIAPNGDIYVADGYGSDYILHYNHRGEFIRKFGGHDNTDERHNLRNAHGVAVDLRDPGNPVLICTSRMENAFKIFSMDGQYLDTIELPGAFVCRPVIHDEHLYAGVCWSKENGTGKRNNGTGFVTILDRQNRVVSNLGGNEPVYTDGKLQPIYQTVRFVEHGHDVAVDAAGDVFVCQWNAHQAYPYKLERVS